MLPYGWTSNCSNSKLIISETGSKEETTRSPAQRHFPHNNAHPHTANLTELGWDLLPHPPKDLDLSA